MANRVVRFKNSFQSGEGTNSQSGPAPVVVESVPVSEPVAVSTGEPVASEVAVKSDSLNVEEVLPAAPPEPNRSKPERSAGQRRKRAKEESAGDTQKGSGYVQVAIPVEVFGLFMRCKSIWIISKNRTKRVSHGSFLQFLLEEFSSNNKFVMKP